MSIDLRTHIERRIRVAAKDIHGDVIAIEHLERYVQLLSHWNHKINLTSLQLDPPTDDAIDRLIVEPVMASWLVQPTNVRIVDLGSGGGSPALPMLLQLPGSRTTMIESRSRKCAFLREAVRQLDLRRASVEEIRFDEIPHFGHLRKAANVVTIRAVRLDQELLEILSFLLAPRGRVFRFANKFERSTPRGMRLMASHTLIQSTGSVLQILHVLGL